MNTYVSEWLAQVFQNQWKFFIVQWLALLLSSFANRVLFLRLQLCSLHALCSHERSVVVQYMFKSFFTKHLLLGLHYKHCFFSLQMHWLFFPSIFELWNISVVAALALMENLVLGKYLSYFQLPLLMQFSREKQGMLAL